MKKKTYMLGALLLLLTANSCRQESDFIQNYSSSDILPFMKAEKSFAEQFNIFWHGMDQNYCLFAYDATFGLDWDAVYDEYLPQFQALDEQKDVTDDELKALVTKLTTGLHDGHFFVSFKNYHTGNEVRVQPSGVANANRPDIKTSEAFNLDLSHYYPTEGGGNGEFKSWSTASVRPDDFFSSLNNNPNNGLLWIKNEVKKLTEKKEKKTATDHENYLLESYSELYEKLKKVLENFGGRMSIQEYNAIVAYYAYLNVPGLIPYSEELSENSMKASTGVTQDNIAYFYMSDFSLDPCVSDDTRTEMMPNLTAGCVLLVKSVGAVWQQWFDSVQSLLKNGQLKGVIIDLRSNGGGLADDFKYVVGSLLPTGSHQIGYTYYKRGVGRFDYSATMPQHVEGYTEPHEVITSQPVVILTNCTSVSMSEISTLSAKELLNACQIGTTTWGGLCGLTENDTFSTNYSGHVGIADKTPVFCYIPQLVFSDLTGTVYEGVGVKPDIELPYDEALYKSQRRDNQFERALQYIREKSK